jgi:hypothetical protein
MDVGADAELLLHLRFVDMLLCSFVIMLSVNALQENSANSHLGVT